MAEGRKIDVEIAFTGADKARSQMEGLAGATDEWSESLANVSKEELEAARKLERLEKAESRLRSKLSNNAGFQQHVMAARQAGREAERLARAEAMAARELEIAGKRADIAADHFLEMVGAQERAGEASASMSSRVGSATASLGGMISVVGAGNPDMARLGGVMSVVGSAASQMGQSMDLVSITIAAMTVAVSALAAGMDHLAEEEAQLREENNRLEHSYQDLAQEISNTLATASRVQRNMRGLGTEIEAEAELRHLESLQEVTQRELDQYERQRRELSGLQRTFGGAELDRLDRAINLRRQTLIDLRAGIAGARLGVEAARDTQIAETIEDTFDAAEDAARRRRRGGRHRDNSEQLARERIRLAEEEKRLIEQIDEAVQRRIQTERELAKELAEAAALAREREAAARVQAGADAVSEAEKEQQRRAVLANQRLEDIRKEEEERQRQVAQTRSQVTDMGDEVGAVFSNAFRLAITGQEDLGVALQQGFSDLMLQKGTEAIFDGTKALFEAVGYAATGNAPAAAGKATEGVGLIALGASVGAIGAAIAPPAGGGAERPRSEPEPGEGGGGTTILNFDSPLAIVGSEREVAMQLNATVSRGIGRQLTPTRRAA